MSILLTGWKIFLRSQRCWNLGRVRGGAQIKIDRSSRIAAVLKAANMPHLQHHGTDLCLEAACGSWKACVYRVAHGTECNWRKLICSTVRLERLFVTNMQNQ